MIQFYISWEGEGEEGYDGNLKWKKQDRTLSKNNNPGFFFLFLQLIIWNIDIHTCPQTQNRKTQHITEI